MAQGLDAGQDSVQRESRCSQSPHWKLSQKETGTWAEGQSQGKSVDSQTTSHDDLHTGSAHLYVCSNLQPTAPLLHVALRAHLSVGLSG